MPQTHPIQTLIVGHDINEQGGDEAFSKFWYVAKLHKIFVWRVEVTHHLSRVVSIYTKLLGVCTTSHNKGWIMTKGTKLFRNDIV